jgi:hypothetical protein
VEQARLTGLTCLPSSGRKSATSTVGITVEIEAIVEVE